MEALVEWQEVQMHFNKGEVINSHRLFVSAVDFLHLTDKIPDLCRHCRW